MSYKAKNIDTDKFLENLENKRQFKTEEKERRKIAVEEYYKGYIDCLDAIENDFYCSNYEKAGDSHA
jgi:hypothetical protein